MGQNTNELRIQLEHQSKTRNEAFSKMQKASSYLKNLERKYSERIYELQEKEKILNSKVTNAYINAYPSQQSFCKKTKAKGNKEHTTPQERTKMKEDLKAVIKELKFLTGKINSAGKSLKIAEGRFEIEEARLKKLSKQYQESKIDYSVASLVSSG